MKQECPTYLKSIGENKTLAATLSDLEPKVDYDESDQEGIVSAFTATIKSTEEVVDVIDDKEELMESKYDQDDIHSEKLYRLATRKLGELELEHEELFTMVDEANQNIGALRFKKNSLVEKAKKLDIELFQVRA